MTNWTMAQKNDNALMASFPSLDVRIFLGFDGNFPSGEPARWLLDSFQLISVEWPNRYGDYSFIVMPASKAVENWIFHLADSMQLETNTNKLRPVRDQIEKYLDSCLDQVENKLGDEIKTDVTYLKNFIQEYRNDIVHCRTRIQSVNEAKNKVLYIFTLINSVTEKLFRAGILRRDDLSKQ